MNEHDFRERLAANGYGEVRVLTYEPDHTPELHDHDFSAMGLVTGGELTIVHRHDRTTYRPGEWYEVPAGTTHSEHTGAAGATALLGVKPR